MPNPRKLSDRQLRKMVFSEPVQGEAESDTSFAERYENEMDFPRNIFQDDSGHVPPKDPQWADLDPWGHYIDRLGLPRRFPRNRKGKHLQAPARTVSRGSATLPAWLAIDPKAPDPDDGPNKKEKKFPGPSVWWSGLTILQRPANNLLQSPLRTTRADTLTRTRNESAWVPISTIIDATATKASTHKVAPSKATATTIIIPPVTTLEITRFLIAHSLSAQANFSRTHIAKRCIANLHLALSISRTNISRTSINSKCIGISNPPTPTPTPTPTSNFPAKAIKASKP
ncbi:hypothetical protein Hte_005133 [Hypoxylon texense]